MGHRLTVMRLDEQRYQSLKKIYTYNVFGRFVYNVFRRLARNGFGRVLMTYNKELKLIMQYLSINGESINC